MADDVIEIKIDTDFNVKSSKNQINEIGEYFKSKVGKDIQNSIDLGKNRRLATFKNKYGKYSLATYNADEKGKVAGDEKFKYSVLGNFSKKEARRLQGSVDENSLKANIGLINLERKEAKKKQESSKQEIKNETKKRDIQKKTIKDKKIELSQDIKSSIFNSKRIGGIQKLFNTIKRVGFYRIARNIFRFIENGFKNGINNLVQFDKQANNTMSSISTSLEKMTGSFTLMLMPLMEMLEPIIKDISNAISGFAENISMASASMKGMTKYTKINDEYMKDLAQQSNSTTLSFDKFESLNSQESMYTEVEMSDEQKEGAKEYAKYLEKIRDIINTITDVIKGLFEALSPYIEPALSFLKDVVDFILKIIKWLGDDLPYVLLTIIGLITAIKIAMSIASIISALNPVTLAIIGIVALIAGIVFVFKRFGNEIKSFFEAVGKGIYNFFADIANGIIGIINDITGFFENIVNGIIDFVKDFAPLLNKLGVDLNVSNVNFHRIQYVQYKASGGMVDKGSLFVAGEAGAELVTTMPSGQTGVTNVAQFKQAMLEALYEWGGGFGGEQGAVVLNLDGAEIARSKRFTGEMNRRNAGLNLR